MKMTLRSLVPADLKPGMYAVTTNDWIESIRIRSLQVLSVHDVLDDASKVAVRFRMIFDNPSPNDDRTFIRILDRTIPVEVQSYTEERG